MELSFVRYNVPHAQLSKPDKCSQKPLYILGFPRQAANHSENDWAKLVHCLKNHAVVLMICQSQCRPCMVMESHFPWSCSYRVYLHQKQLSLVFCKRFLEPVSRVQTLTLPLTGPGSSDKLVAFPNGLNMPTCQGPT